MIYDKQTSLPSAHAQGVKQSVLSVVGTKIARSQDLGIQATRKHNKSVEFGKKNWLQYALNRLAWSMKITNSVFHWPCLRLLSAHAHTPGLLWVGKGRQQIHDCAALCCNSQIDAEAAHGVCALVITV